MLKQVSVWLLLINLTIGACPAEALPSDADTVRSMQALALESCARRDIDTGLKTFKQAISLARKTFGKDSDYVCDLCFEAGVAALKISRYAEAENFLNEAVAVNPNASEARLKLADYYRRSGKFTSAKRQIAQVLSRDPDNIEAHGLLGATYQKEGDVANAFEQYRKVDLLSIAQPLQYRQPLSGSPAAAKPDVGDGAVIDFHRLPEPAARAPAAAPEQTAPVQPPQAPEQKVKSIVQPTPSKPDKRKAKAGRSKAEHGRSESPQRSEQAQDDDQQSISGMDARLRSKARLLTRIKNGPHSEFDSIESALSAGQAGSAGAARLPGGKRVPGKPAVDNAGRSGREGKRARAATAHSGKHMKTPGGMVPPPPAVPAVMPVFLPPPQAPRPLPPRPLPAHPSPAVAKAPVLKAATPKVDPGEEKPAAASPPPSSASTSSNPDDEGDFLLDWAGKKKKKK